MYKLNTEETFANKIGTGEWHGVNTSAEYLAWLSEGNTPEPADVPPAPTYQELRAAAYPPMSDYLDGIVKGDAEQVAAYVAACLAVKAQFPK